MKPRNVQEFLETYWQLEKIPGTHIKIHRGQRIEQALKPRLFRSCKTIEQVDKLEAELIAKFQKACPYLLPSKPDNIWDWLSIGQHYTLPTRLSDWSSNPLTALFFAVEKDHEQNEPKLTPIVYIYHAKQNQILTDAERQTIKPREIRYHKVVEPSVHSHRIAMQSAWHFAHRSDTGPAKLKGLDELGFHDARLHSIRVDPQHVKSIRDELSNNWGIKPATVYGDLQAVCDSIRRFFQLE